MVRGVRGLHEWGADLHAFLSPVSRWKGVGRNVIVATTTLAAVSLGVTPLAGASASSSVTSKASKAPSIWTAASSTWIFGIGGSFQVEATGAGPFTYSEKGTLPPKVKFSSGGLLSGVPAGAATKEFAIQIAAHASDGRIAKQSFKLVVHAPCTATVAQAKLVQATKQTLLNVTSLPSCFRPTSTTGGPAEAGSTLVNAKRESAKQLLIAGPTTFTAHKGMVVNFYPVIVGTLSCSNFKGTLTFSPPLRNNEGFIPKETTSGTANCTIHPTLPSAARGAVSPRDCDWCGWLIPLGIIVLEVVVTGVTDGVALAEAAATSAECGDIAPGSGFTPPTQTNFPDGRFVTGANEKLELVTNGITPTVRGSFAGKDVGASSSLTFHTDLTAAQLNKEGATKVGIKTIKFTSGSIFLG